MRWLLVGILLVAPAAAAESGDAAFLLFRDPAGERYVVAMEPQPTYEYGFWGAASSPIYTGGGREWLFEFDLAEPLPLDPERSMSVVLVVGGAALEAGVADLGWQLESGGVVVATGADQSLVYAENKRTLSWSVQAPDVALAAGDVLRVATSSHMGRGVRLDLEPSGVVLPIRLPAVAAHWLVTYEDAAGPLHMEFDQRTGTHEVNWTVAPADGTARLSWSVVSGNASLQIWDAARQMVLNTTLASDGAQEIAFTSAAGTWRVRLVMEDFAGWSSMEVQQAAKSGEPAHVEPSAQAEPLQTAPATPQPSPAAREAPAQEAPLGWHMAGFAALVAVAVRRRTA